MEQQIQPIAPDASETSAYRRWADARNAFFKQVGQTRESAIQALVGNDEELQSLALYAILYEWEFDQTCFDAIIKIISNSINPYLVQNCVFCLSTILIKNNSSANAAIIKGGLKSTMSCLKITNAIYRNDIVSLIGIAIGE